MTFAERLESLTSEQEYARLLNGIRDRAKGSEFAELVAYALDNTEKNLIALLKRMSGTSDNLQNLAGRIQQIEVLRTCIFQPNIIEEETPDGSAAQ